MPYKNKEVGREKARLNYYKNRDKRLSQQRIWDRKNKSKKREYDKKRRDLKNENIKTKIRHYSTKNHLPVLLEKYKGCQICGLLNNLEIHHTRYTKQLKHAMLVCRKCHKDIHRKH